MFKGCNISDTIKNLIYNTENKYADESEKTAPIKNKEKREILFPIDFLRENKHKYKVIYKNKLYPLRNLSFDLEKNNKNSDCKLLYLLEDENFEKKSEYKIAQKYKKIEKNIIKIPNIYDPEEENKFDLEINNIQKVKFNYFPNLEFIFYDSYYISYKKNIKNDKIKIFGKNFVKNNKDKCIIIYNNIIYFLTEFF